MGVLEIYYEISVFLFFLKDKHVSRWSPNPKKSDRSPLNPINLQLGRS